MILIFFQISLVNLFGVAFVFLQWGITGLHLEKRRAHLGNVPFQPTTNFIKIVNVLLLGTARWIQGDVSR